MSHDFEHDLVEDHDHESLGDIKEEQALIAVEKLFVHNPAQVFFTRQIEIRFEDRFYHWITNRAVHRLYEESRLIERMQTKLITGTPVTLWWNRKGRYKKRAIKAVLDLINEYSAPEVGEYLGLHGQDMMLGAFARASFNIVAENTNEFGG